MTELDRGAQIVLAGLMRTIGPALDDDRWWYMGSTREPGQLSFVAELIDGETLIRYRVSVERLQ